MIKNRSGHAGIIATVILMFSIALFMGTILWLVTDAGFLFGGPGTSLFKPAIAGEDSPITLNQTINRLHMNGCMIVYYSKEYTGDYDHASYDIFMKAAISEKIVYRVDRSDKDIVLLVISQGRTLEWASKR